MPTQLLPAREVRSSPVSGVRRPSSPARAVRSPSGVRSDRLGPAQREVMLSTIGLVVTIVATVGVVMSVTSRALQQGEVVAPLVFLVLVGGLIWGALAHLVSRLGFHARRDSWEPDPDAAWLFEGAERSLTVLVPSYREEIRVVRQTLIAAGLQTHPGVDVVLLIDDPPTSDDRAAAVSLAAARELPGQLESWLSEPRSEIEAALQRFRAVRAAHDACPEDEARRLADQLDRAAVWFEQQAGRERVRTHTDALFVNEVYRESAVGLRLQRAELRRRWQQGDTPDLAELDNGYRRLLARFDASFSSFERKRYANLSHAPNKAMNLNSYLGLLGADWREVDRPDGTHLVPVEDDASDPQSTLRVPAPPFVITLDADSIIHPDYAATLVGVAERPGNEDIAVCQTPYSAVPDAPSGVERIAGATTDVQYVIHQGFEWAGASFWVGANALIRTAALTDIEVVAEEDGHEVVRFISDWTVIEDTESSLDLAAEGWRIHNHPNRLSFSATPPDFGSLVIQRRRWANGGLILAPKLAQVVGGSSMVGLFLRAHYLLSITMTNIALLLLLYTTIGAEYASWWLPLSAVPYFALYARDLHQAGYRAGEVVAVYALNLLLVPTNLAGVAKSVEQVVRRGRTPFARTPKVEGRTPAPALYHVMAMAMLLVALAAAGWDVLAGRFAHAGFALVNGALLYYAITRFIGWRELVEDVGAAVVQR